ncbi:carboxymuconolactone decarboxylase family protein [Roseateles sp. DB2]|uniref:carboxymuconolactone decarboxylase family protein n=1 Tax=Roseateles sp. DB2 TaxID=3453717 RepID=UPI003EE9B210
MSEVHAVEPRLDWAAFEKDAGGVVLALRELGRAVDASGLDKGLSELLKVRVSQINGCAFCLQYHLNLGRKLGLPALQLDQLACWSDSPAFAPRERAALAWAEVLTLQASRPDTDAAYAALQVQFSAAEIANLTAAIGHINAWNRIAGGLRFTPPSA